MKALVVLTLCMRKDSAVLEGRVGRKKGAWAAAHPEEGLSWDMMGRGGGWAWGSASSGTELT